MARHLTEADIDAIINLLQGWDQKLSWDALCKACLPVIGIRPVRQTLLKFNRITWAYKTCKKRLRDKAGLDPQVPRKVLPTVAKERIMRLERENAMLKEENKNLLERFFVWQYNAYASGLTLNVLNQAMPSIDRTRMNS